MGMTHYVTVAQVVYDMQATFSCLGAFVCIWGFIQFLPCLIRVLMNRHLHPSHAQCPFHASMAMLCVAGIVFAFARMNTIGFFIFGSTAAGLAYIAGMIIVVVTVALSVWAQGRTHEEACLRNWRTPVPNAPNLSRILTALIIVVLAFIGVGLLRLGS